MTCGGLYDMGRKVFRFTLIFLFSLVFVSSQVAAVDSFSSNSSEVEDSLREELEVASNRTEGVFSSITRYFFGSEEKVDRSSQGLESFTVEDYRDYRVKYKSSYSFGMNESTENVYLLKHKANSTQVLQMEEVEGEGCRFLQWDNGALPGKWSNDSGRYEFYSEHQQSVIGFKFSGYDRSEKVNTQCTLNFSSVDSNSSFQHTFDFTMENVALVEGFEEFVKNVFGLKGVSLYDVDTICPMGIEDGSFTEDGGCYTFPTPTVQGLYVLALFGFILWLLRRMSEISGKAGGL